MTKFTVEAIRNGRNYRRTITARDANEAEARMRRAIPGCYWIVVLRPAT